MVEPNLSKMLRGKKIKFQKKTHKARFKKYQKSLYNFSEKFIIEQTEFSKLVHAPVDTQNRKVRTKPIRMILFKIP